MLYHPDRYPNTESVLIAEEGGAKMCIGPFVSPLAAIVASLYARGGRTNHRLPQHTVSFTILPLAEFQAAYERSTGHNLDDDMLHRSKLDAYVSGRRLPQLRHFGA